MQEPGADLAIVLVGDSHLVADVGAERAHRQAGGGGVLHEAATKLKRIPKIQECFKANGDYDRIKGAAYELVFEDEEVTTIRYIGGDEVETPKHVTLTREFVMQHWWSDDQCTLEFSPQKLYLSQFFGKNTGPNADPPTKKAILAEARGVANEVLKNPTAATEGGTGLSQQVAVTPPVKAQLALPKSSAQEKEKLKEKAKETLAKARIRKKQAQELKLTDTTT